MLKNIYKKIAPKYEITNHFLTFGLDFYWRKKALALTKMSDETILLDIACGTGDFAIAAKNIGVKKIFGADLSMNMLTLFKKKSSWIDGKVVQMVAENIPLQDDSVTNITVAFGVRNFYDISYSFNSFYSVLKQGGKVTILEFRMPSNKFFKGLYKFYFKKILPVVGGILSGNREAYSYLPNSVEEFDEKIVLPELLKKAGFREINMHPLTLGIVQVVIAVK
ncbi:MAG: bifunctional demethylmenaquinone methyltransferase/2-methoxy-6-polyprenyl-1,4-benzoquinol methylase UbiE [Ignavibacteriae bacterium]|nr:MAG: bifunctional demethylmenaquinone methyltransferase/2-methoxy-6-polyprenyl-1,4-benzoquinol methylase UbiE [Ignavibacteriota bacterium]